MCPGFLGGITEICFNLKENEAIVPSKHYSNPRSHNRMASCLPQLLLSVCIRSHHGRPCFRLLLPGGLRIHSDQRTECGGSDAVKLPPITLPVSILSVEHWAPLGSSLGLPASAEQALPTEASWTSPSLSSQGTTWLHGRQGLQLRLAQRY